MYNAPYAGVANELAKFGRYGDSELVHLNPIEVQMLASLSPTGRLTDNPFTGQKEAFLPFLAPLLGSFLGNAALGSTLGATAAGALGSAAATTLATGDLEQGIMAGITGFGIGSALGAAGNAATEAAKTATTQAATDAATTFSPSAAAATMNPLAADTTLRAAIESTPSIFSPGAAGAQMTAAPNFADVVATPPVTPPTPTFTERLAAPVQQPGAFFSALTEPASFLPMYVGETGRMAREQELMGRGSMAAYEEEQEAQRQKTLGQIGGVYDRIRAAYPGVGYAQGGMIERYAVGGGIENAIRQAAINAGYGGEYGNFSGSLPYNIPDPESVQLSLRGSQFVPPPASSYSALDVGGEGYLAGMAPEFQYFREPPPPPAGYVPPPPGTVAGGGGTPGGGDMGGFDFGNFLSGFRGLQNLYGRPGAGAGADVGAGAGPIAGRGPITTEPTGPIGPEDLTMYPGGSATFDETAGGGFDTSILEDLLKQRPNIPAGTTPDTQPETASATQPQLSPFMGVNMADLEQRLAELTQSQNAPISTENTTQYDPNRGRQVFETPQVTFDTENISAQPEIPVSRPAIPPRLEAEPEVTRGIGAFREPAISYTPPEVYRSPQPVQMEPELRMEPEPIYQAPAAPPPLPPSPAMRPQPTVETPIARAPAAPAPVVPPAISSLEEFIRNAGGELAAGLDRAPQAAPAAPMPVAPPSVTRQSEPVFQPPVTAPPVAAAPVEMPSFDPQLLEQLIAMSPSPEAASQQDRGFGGASNFDNPFGEFGSSDTFAEGGMVNKTNNDMGEENSIVDMTVAAIRGEIENADQIIRRFVEMYGPEVFMQLREQVLQEIVPGAQTNGMVEGEGGGQDDLVNGMIGTQRPVAVSPGEYIIPADVVSLAGGGYSGDGAKYFDSLIDDIRQKTMGTTEQIRPYRRSG